MSIIKILPPHEAQKIAAGEVVERPASVIKEVVENALDANATAITIYIEHAGKSLIRVIDNGCGMQPDDAHLSFHPHATSKITTLDDIETIATFGFRGEALASIASISQITLLTKTNKRESDHDLGFEIIMHGGTLISAQAVACAPGTDVSIAELFYNTPVRKKFLKQDETEWHQIQNIIHAFCLSHQHVHFKLFRDKALILNAPPTHNIIDRIHQVWGRSVAQNMIPLVDSPQDQNTIHITGAISHHQFFRYNRSNLYFFVNGRLVKNSGLGKALMNGYLNVLPPGKFPAGCIYITVQGTTLDINVHPRKEEVQFSKPRIVEKAIEHLVTQTLQELLTRNLGHESSSTFFKIQTYAAESVLAKPDQTVSKTMHTNFDQFSTPVFAYKPVFYQSESLSSVHTKENDTVSQAATFKNNKIALDTIIPDIKPASPVYLSEQETFITSDHSQIIGQLFNTYILIEHETHLTIVDQHAAHERIMYERLLKNFAAQEGTELLFPLHIKLSTQEVSIVLTYQEFLTTHGIKIKNHAETEIIIISAPVNVQSIALSELIHEMCAYIQEHHELAQEVLRKKLHEHMHSQMACKSAIKAGDVLSTEQMRQLIAELALTPNRLICAHGRPTIWTIAKTSIEKNFQRRL